MSAGLKKNMKWFKKLFLIYVIIVAAAVLLAYVRYKTCFFPGLQGLFIGMLLGAIAGKVSQDCEEIYSFRKRLRLSLTLALFFIVIQTLAVSALYSGEEGGLFAWIGNILDGYTKEFFFSMGKTGAIVKTASGQIRGFWWFFMTLLDAVLFAFGHLAGLMIGLPASTKTKIPYRD